MNSVQAAEAPTVVLERVTDYKGRHQTQLVFASDWLRVESAYTPYVPRHAAPEDGAR